MSQVGAKLRAPSCLVGDGDIDARIIGAPQHSAPPWSRNPPHLEHVVMRGGFLPLGLCDRSPGPRGWARVAPLHASGTARDSRQEVEEMLCIIEEGMLRIRR